MSECGRKRGRDRGTGEVGGEGVKAYDTQGGGGARESLEEAERRGGNETRKGGKRIEWQELHACLSEDAAK